MEASTKGLQRTTISILWEHYSREELPRKALSTQDSYSMYAKNWIVPRWGNMQFGPDQDSRSRAVAAGNRGRRMEPKAKISV